MIVIFDGATVIRHHRDPTVPLTEGLLISG
jgi:hypothetical protein